MTHEQALDNLNRHLDGELDETLRGELAQHVETCPQCQAVRQTREALSAVVAQSSMYYHAPPQLTGRVMAKIAPRPQWHFITRWASLGAAAAVIALGIASSLAFLAPLPGGDPTYQYVIDSYKRAAAGQDDVDLFTSKVNMIDDWLKDRIALPVPTREIASTTFVLNGVRMDALGERKVAVLVYSAGKSEIDIFEWPDPVAPDDPPMTDQVGDFTVARWSVVGVRYWAVTATHDKSVADLHALVQLLAAPPATSPTGP